MGTENYIGDDVLIIADPYDSTDHIQDGFIVWNFIRYFYLLKVVGIGRSTWVFMR